MCGIGGVWGSAVLEQPARIGALFADALAHRGPDGEGFLAIPAERGRTTNRCTRLTIPSDESLSGLLVHRRLSIIDLKTGDQPMSSPDARLWIVYNGEIYNYRELRAELGAIEGEQFVTSSDTEVILRVYRRWGPEGFRRLNGIFAFALLDTTRDEIVLARDPLGVKPLYWTQRESAIAFASEVRPFLAAGMVSPAVDPDALAQYLYFRFVPAPRTMWRQVHKLRPGYALRINRSGRIVDDRDFSRPAPVTTDRPARVLAGLPDLLYQAVRRQMVSDVPVGAFLSGGLDSSIVVAASRDAGATPQSFGVGFPSDPEVFNELDSASEAARILGVPFEPTVVSAESYFQEFPRAVIQLEEPLAEAGMHLLSRLAATASRRVKVVLTGQGADEPLGGYLRHQATKVALLLRAAVPRRSVAGWRSSHEGFERFVRVLSVDDGPQLAAAPFGSLSPEEAGRFVSGLTSTRGAEVVEEAVSVWWRKGEGLDDLSRILYVDTRTSLADDLLLMGDKTAMAHGLEARVPYLDLEYLNAVESLPGNFRVPLWRRRKWIQLEVARRVLPLDLARRLRGSWSPLSKKRGFEVPMSLWLRQGFGERLRTILAGSKSVLPDFLNVGYVQSVVDRYLAGSHRPYRTVLALYVLELWMRANVAGHESEQLPTPIGH